MPVPQGGIDHDILIWQIGRYESENGRGRANGVGKRLAMLLILIWGSKDQVARLVRRGADLKAHLPKSTPLHTISITLGQWTRNHNISCTKNDKRHCG